MKQARDRWFDQFSGVRIDQLVFLDEFGATTHMTRTRGRGPRGKRLVCKTPQGHWKVLSTIAAMTTHGMLASASFEGATDSDTFLAFIEEGLAPRLKPGQVLVLDNLSSHKSPRVKQLVEAAGARLLPLPAYSPDFNPIEMAISKIKTLLRSLAQRTVPGLMAAIAQATDSITADDATHYIRHCGYAATSG